MIELRLSALKEGRVSEYVTRFFFGGICTLAAGLVAKRYGPVIAGVFLAFPAIFPSGASMIEAHEKERKAEIGSDGTHRGRMAAAIDAVGASLGCVGLALFGLVVWKLLPHANHAGTLVLAMLVWFTTAVLLWELRKRRFFSRPNMQKPTTE